jgi:aryl-alcohol dehydrogenase-like predicted oxidoreductase
MERRLGSRLPETGTLIITKVGTDRSSEPPRKRFDCKYLEPAIERSLERLRRNTLVVVLLHNPSPQAIERGEATGLLAKLAGAGRITAWGVSISNAEQARAAVAQGAGVVSIPYNAFNAKDLHAVSALVKEYEVGVLAHSVLAYGMLCGQWALDKTFSAEDHRSERWSPDEFRRRLSQLSALRPLIGGPVLTLRAAALRFVLQNSLVGSAVLGPRGVLQLDQLVREAGKEPPYIPEDKLRALTARLNQLGAEQ